MSPDRRILRAISLGVFCRSAPSTSAIILSRNVSPGFAVIRTTIASESTRVPPVTAERSPPDSRITGADSPVIADSSTLAMPSITSPSPGMISRPDHADVAHLQARGRGVGIAPRVRARGRSYPPSPRAGPRPGPCPYLRERLREVREEHREP